MIGGAPSATASHLWNGVQLGEAFAHAADWLDAHRDRVNALNVFPVPDGDTGTNMALTMRSAVGTIAAGETRASEVARQLAYGALMGARGNSGVILSQIFRGFASAVRDRDEIDGRDLAAALDGAREMAYKAVMRPVEGTMLTVIRGAAERASIAAGRSSSLLAVLRESIAGAQVMLEATPTMLDILRQAGVVDAGGQGVVHILEGLERFAAGNLAIDPAAGLQQGIGASMAFLDHIGEQHGEDEFGYCTNFMVFGSGIQFERARDDIAAMGQSAVIVGDDTLLKVHIHTENPGEVLQYAVALGSLDQIKIDNMSLQTETLTGERMSVAWHPDAASSDLADAIAIVAVASGEGVSAALRSMGATSIVTGGQTMNPSTADLLDAVEATAADEVIILPNNANIIPTANQLPELSARTVRIVPTRSIPQALAALALFSATREIDANVEAMTEALTNVTSIEITRAVRSVELNGVDVVVGQLIGLIDDELIASGSALRAVARTLFAKSGRDDAELVTVFSGQDATAEDIRILEEAVAELYPDAEHEFQSGGQPHYLFIVSVE